MKTRYVLLSANENPNIGVLTVHNPSEIISDKELRERLVNSLESFFDAEVKVHSLEEHHQNPIEVRVLVTIGNGDDQNSYSETITMNETWLD